MFNGFTQTPHPLDDNELFLRNGWPTKGDLLPARTICQTFSPLQQMSNSPQAEFEPVQNLSSDFVEKLYSSDNTTTARCNNDQNSLSMTKAFC